VNRFPVALNAIRFSFKTQTRDRFDRSRSKCRYMYWQRRNRARSSKQNSVINKLRWSHCGDNICGDRPTTHRLATIHEWPTKLTNHVTTRSTAICASQYGHCVSGSH